LEILTIKMRSHRRRYRIREEQKPVTGTIGAAMGDMFQKSTQRPRSAALGPVSTALKRQFNESRIEQLARPKKPVQLEKSDLYKEMIRNTDDLAEKSKKFFQTLKKAVLTPEKEWASEIPPSCGQISGDLENNVRGFSKNLRSLVLAKDAPYESRLQNLQYLVEITAKLQNQIGCYNGSWSVARK
jgi:hypothetical protein